MDAANMMCFRMVIDLSLVCMVQTTWGLEGTPRNVAGLEIHACIETSFSIKTQVSDSFCELNIFFFTFYRNFDGDNVIEP